jgi:hypothetical protein
MTLVFSATEAGLSESWLDWNVEPSPGMTKRAERQLILIALRVDALRDSLGRGDEQRELAAG